MWSNIYKKIVIDFSKITLLFLAILIGFSFYHAKNFNLDASSDALLLEGDKDLKYLREINNRYGSPVSTLANKSLIQILLAFTIDITELFLGLINSHGKSLCTASINLSVITTP